MHEEFQRTLLAAGDDVRWVLFALAYLWDEGIRIV